VDELSIRHVTFTYLARQLKGQPGREPGAGGWCDVELCGGNENLIISAANQLHRKGITDE
jgi:hypothetical protein